jgi:radical SAM superfamily enzyme YgiQ (UPF0313 family)
MQNGLLPSYSMLYLDAFLNQKGIQTEIFYPLITHERQPDFAKKIADLHPKVVGIGGMYDDRFTAKRLIESLSPYRSHFKTVVGGDLVTPIPEFMLTKLKADVCVVGEGEIVFSRFVENILGGKDYFNVGGLVFNAGNKIISTGPGQFVEDLNTLPRLNYDKIPMEHFINVFPGYKTNTRTSLVYKPGTRLGSIPTGRGCPFTCNFCFHYHKMRQIKISNIIAQAKELQERFNINLIRFADDLTFLRKKQTLEFCRAWQDERVNLNYMISAHFSGIDEEVVLALKESGCVQVGLGLESGSQRILDKINKKVKLEQIRSGIELLNKHKVLWNGAIQIGQIDETEEDVRRTITFYYPYVNERSTISVLITTPYPGTPLYNYGLSTGLIKSHEDAYQRFKNVRSISFNFSRMSEWKIRYLRLKIILIFDITKQVKMRGIVKGMGFFIKTVFLKLVEKLQISPRGILCK